MWTSRAAFIACRDLTLLYFSRRMQEKLPQSFKAVCFNGSFDSIMFSRVMETSVTVFLFFMVTLGQESDSFSSSSSDRVPTAVRAPKRLGSAAYESLAKMNDLQVFTALLAPLMVRRVPSTPRHTQVKEFIINKLESSGFTVSTQDFTARVPVMDNFIRGQEMPFSNVIATFHPSAPKKLVFACHYDSKYFNERSNFIGAIDSAVPCAMLLDMARTLSKSLSSQRNPEVTLQLIFFDGEEAFKDWSPTDSLYGSRALAEHWDRTGELRSIELFVLLDLLGGEIGECQSGFFRQCPELASYMRVSQPVYDRIVAIEESLGRRNLLQNHQGLKRYFQKSQKYHVQIEDDHLPFMRRGVPILHVITAPFPPVWHEDSDNADSLHWPTIQNLNTIFRVMAAEYLELNI